MKKLIILTLFIIYSITIKAQSSPDFDTYNDYRTWIPDMSSDPLKYAPVKTVQLAFHVFLDDNGERGVYTDDEDSRNHLKDILSWVNGCYNGSRSNGPSDPVSGVTELPDYDTRIQFSLGEPGQERIFFYNNSALNNYSDIFGSRTPFQTFLSDPNNPDAFPDWPNYLNVYWTGAHRGADVLEEWPTGVDNIVITNGGSGYSASNRPTVIFSAAGASTAAQGTAIISNGQITGIEVTDGGSYYQVDVPTITISGGMGTGATAIVKDLHPGGALGDYPSATNPNYNESVVMPSTVSPNFGEWGRFIALKHELGHCLDLRHTYCNGGGSPFTCSAIFCTQATPFSPSEYLEDIFGPCASSTIPHLDGWVDPWDPNIPNADLHTNNLMGGCNVNTYISPGQAGKMHRSLAIKSARKYVNDDVYSSTPYILSQDEDWDFDIRFYRDIIIPAGKTLTSSGTIEIPTNASIEVDGSNSKLVIEGDFVIQKGRSINAKSGGIIDIKSGANLIIRDNAGLVADLNSTIIVRNGANVTVEEHGMIQIKDHGHLCIESGANFNLNDSPSQIVLNEGSIIGNENITINNPITGASIIVFSGNGYINDCNQDLLIENESFSFPPLETELVKKNVTINNAGQGGGPVVVNPGKKLDIEATEQVTINKDFEVKYGAGLEIK